jgi:hypothetical protein
LPIDEHVVWVSDPARVRSERYGGNVGVAAGLGKPQLGRHFAALRQCSLHPSHGTECHSWNEFRPRVVAQRELSPGRPLPNEARAFRLAQPPRTYTTPCESRLVLRWILSAKSRTRQAVDSFRQTLQ